MNTAFFLSLCLRISIFIREVSTEYESFEFKWKVSNGMFDLIHVITSDLVRKNAGLEGYPDEVLLEIVKSKARSYGMYESFAHILEQTQKDFPLRTSH